MRYLILLWGDASGEAALPDDERRAIVEAHIAFSARLRERGQLVLGEAVDHAGTLVRGGVITDGPFVETKEQLGGFYVVDVESEEDALALAREVPESPGLVVELRPTSGP